DNPASQVQNETSELDTPAEILEVEESRLSEQDLALNQQAAEFFGVQILGEEMTPDLMQNWLENLDPQMARAIRGVSVEKRLAVEATEDRAAIYDIQVKLGLKWVDEMGVERNSPLSANLQLQY